MHFDALRLVALREGGRIDDTLATENEKMLIRAPAHVHPAHAGYFPGAQPTAHPQPALRTGFMPPAWRLALLILGVILDFDACHEAASAGTTW